MRFLAFLAFLFSLEAYSHSFMPENDLHLNPPESLSSMTEAEFNAIVDEVVDAYQPFVKEYGAKLVGIKDWDTDTVNAYAQQFGSTWQIKMFGGLARRPEVTPDGFALVACHEVGHHLAGYPFYNARWAASEGNSDYFATHQCAKVIWGDEPERNAEAADDVDDYAKEKCDEVWRTKADRDLCYRASNAGYSLALLLSRLGRQGDPSFETPDQAKVPRTSPRHPRGQCRLDTYFQGALCKAKFTDSFIPGKRNPNGQDSKFAEHESAANSCFRSDGYKLGTRPLCWFAPGFGVTTEVVSFSKFY